MSVSSTCSLNSLLHFSAVVRYIAFLIISALLVSTMANENVKAVTRGNNAFTNKLYNELSKKAENGNIFFSPISAHTILSLLDQGAEAESHKALKTTLDIPDKQLAADGFKNVMGALNNIQNVTLEMANKVYAMDGYKLKENFKQVATKDFFAEAQNINFAENEAAAKTINTWVEEKTKDKIKNLISPDSLNSLTRLVLVNAIYFKGDWEKKFDKENTREEPFYISETEEVKCQMMHKTSKYDYAEIPELDAKVLQIPYKNKDVSLVVVLPNKRNGIKDLENKLANYDLNKLTHQMSFVEVIVSLPKFKIETTMELNDPLKNMGLANIFSPNANFSGLLDSPEELYVSKVVQKAFIEVNEEGAEAAAATGVFMMAMCYIAPREFKADHPFIYFIQAAGEEKNPLFFGKLNNV